MYINAATPYNTNFQAIIKMRKPNLKVISQMAIGSGAVTVAGASIAEAGLSVYAMDDNRYAIESIPKEVIESHRDFLYEDNGGRGLPVFSTMAPTAMSLSAVFPSTGASNAFNKAIGEDNIKASTAIPLDSSVAVSKNKYGQKSMIGAGYLGTAAASICSGLYGEESNQMLPQSVQSHPGFPEPYEYGDEPTESYAGQCAYSSGISGIGSLGIPVVGGTFYGLSKASDTKSSQFVADTLSDNNKSEKKILS